MFIDMSLYSSNHSSLGLNMKQKYIGNMANITILVKQREFIIRICDIPYLALDLKYLSTCSIVHVELIVGYWHE